MAKDAPKVPKMTSKDVLRCLKGRFASPEWMFATELSLVPGFIRGRRADAVAMNCFNGDPWGQAFVGFEVKVTRADFLAELREPQKRAETYEGCDALFLAVPKGLVKAAEVPEDMGLIECWTTDKVDYARVKRQPPKLHELPVPSATKPDPKWGHKVLSLDDLKPVPRYVAVAFLRSFDDTRFSNKYFTKSLQLQRTLDDQKYKNRRLLGVLKEALNLTLMP